MTALAYLEHALRDAHVVELRYCAEERWTSGVYTDIDRLRDAIRSRYRAGNLYISINRPRADLPVPNGPAKPLTDADIERIVRIPIDFDPVRPAECMATEAELARAVAARDRFVAAMRTAGWPMPLTATSGSGAHAMYRCSIPASELMLGLFQMIYCGWRDEFATDSVGFDAKVRNPSRIFRLYGTVNRKGPSTPERPWRRACCEFPAGAWQAVQLRQIEALAEWYSAFRLVTPAPGKRSSVTPIHGSGDYRTLDVVALVRGHGLYKRPLGGGKHAVACPWGGEHSSADHRLRTDSVVWEANPGEWPRFYCSHAHCEGRTMRELIAQLGDADAYCARSFTRDAA